MAKMLKTPIEQLLIEQIAELTGEHYVRGLGCTSRQAQALLRSQRKLLQYAASYGWTCEAVCRSQAWEPFRVVLLAGKPAAGSLGIVEFANRLKYWPETFSGAVMEKWKDWMEATGRSPYTIRQAETVFRRKLRLAKMQDRLPQYDLKSKRLDDYQQTLDEMSEELRNEILQFLHWRQSECDVDLRLRPPTVLRLKRALLELCGYCKRELHLCGTTSLREILTEDILKQFIAWCREVRGCLWYSIYTKLACVCFLTQLDHPLFAASKAEYAWFGILLRRLPRDPKGDLRRRKIARSVPYRIFAKLASGIRKELQRNKSLNPIERSRLFRDFFYCVAVARHPWRESNWSGCRIDPKSSPKIDYIPNIDYIEIPRSVQRKGKLPGWVKRALKRAKKEKRVQKFWMCHFVEIETKGKSEIWEPLDPQLVNVFQEYCDVHRPVILGDLPDPGTLLINNAGKAMTSGQLSERLAMLSQQYIGKRLRPHIIRDIVAEHAIMCGCTLQTVQSRLWHKWASSTRKYLSRVNASHGVVVLERHLATIWTRRRRTPGPYGPPRRSTATRKSRRIHARTQTRRK
jgi:hypothetical protein